MRTVISAKDIEEMLRNGGDVRGLPADAVFTPSARDLLRELEGTNRQNTNSGPEAGAKRIAKAVTADSSQGDLDEFFNSPEICKLKQQICDVGQRLWQRAYVDGNGGNIAVRVADGLALCTPTLVSKGFMKPDDLCLVDLEGNQKAGSKKRTSEILMHLQIMKRLPQAKATVHCHPPHATGFAVAGVEPPSCMIPEIEVFIGKVPIAPYRTPGTPEMGKLVADLVEKHNTVLMANHGVVSWSHNDVEDAYFKMEILEAYCRTVIVASQLGQPLKTFTPNQLQDLLNIKQTLGIPDPRFGLKECELCDNEEWRPGVTCAVPSGKSSGAIRPGSPDPEAEALVQAITDQIIGRENL
ncbi:MAG: class II aldolase/adducin family protein [Verrucomicrobia bacterium]|nr:class II aldolase/adducin family protein [Verrucomicrobiota bacterium]